jgi:phosphoribosylglycinamide formyltransferase-1
MGSGVPAPNADPVLGVLVSGRGSNLQALIDASREGSLGASIAVVISNVAEAGALERARMAGIDTSVIDHRGYAARDDFDRAIVAELRRHRVGLVCLAGFMRRLGRPMLDAFPDAVLNIHPSLLPSFPGLHPQRQAIAHGVKVSGATVHLVTAELDAGPIIVQRSVPVYDNDTEESLAARILAEEHRAYPEAVRLVASDLWRLEGRRLVRRVDSEGASSA